MQVKQACYTFQQNTKTAQIQLKLPTLPVPEFKNNYINRPIYQPTNCYGYTMGMYNYNEQIDTLITSLLTQGRIPLIVETTISNE